MRTTGESLQTAYPPLRASARDMREALRAYLAAHGLDATATFEVVLAADEAFTNALSYAGGVDGEIRVTAGVSRAAVWVEVHDDGSGFRYRRSDPRSIPDVCRPNGRGVFLIECMMDEVCVSSARDGTTVRMVKCIA